MNKRIAVSAMLLLAGLNSTTGQAGDRPGAFFARPAIGYYFPASKRQIDGTGASSLILGYDFSERWAMGAGVAVINTEQKSAIGGDSVHGFLYTFDAIYRLQTIKGFSPYVLAGPQITSLKPPTGDDPINQAGVSLGVGTGYFLSDSVGLSFEARDLYTFSGGKNDVFLSAGLVFLFGGHSSPQPVAAPASYK